MSQRLPEIIEPIRMAETRRVLSGRLAIADMSRLKTVLHDMQGFAEVELVFGIDEAGMVNVTGQVIAEVNLLCQRCMEPMPCKVNEKISLAVIRTERQSDDLPSHYEPLLVDEDGFASLTNIVEDEIILALPVSSLHELDVCPAKDKVDQYIRQDIEEDQDVRAEKGRQGAGESAIKTAESKAKNPFAALAQLKVKKQENEP